MANTGLEKLAKLAAAEAIDELGERVAAKISSVETSIPTKTSQITNDSSFQTADEVENAISSQISRVYKPAGTVSFASLPALTAAVLGNVYNVSDAFTTDDKFVDGAGVKISAGTNVVVVQIDEEFKFDVLAGAVDLTNYVEKETGKGLSSNDFTDVNVEKLEGIAAGATKVEASEIGGNIKINGVETQVVAIATDAEINEIISKHFPAAT